MSSASHEHEYHSLEPTTEPQSPSRTFARQPSKRLAFYFRCSAETQAAFAKNPSLSRKPRRQRLVQSCYRPPPGKEHRAGARTLREQTVGAQQVRSAQHRWRGRSLGCRPAARAPSPSRAMLHARRFVTRHTRRNRPAHLVLDLHARNPREKIEKPSTDAPCMRCTSRSLEIRPVEQVELHYRTCIDARRLESHAFRGRAECGGKSATAEGTLGRVNPVVNARRGSNGTYVAPLLLRSWYRNPA